MRALVSEKAGIKNVKFKEIATPQIRENEVLVRVNSTGVNPVDRYIVENTERSPLIAGSEFAGTIEKIGEQVRGFEKGDKVSVYSWLFDKKCDMCLSGNEMICRNVGMVGENIDGGFAEYVAVPSQNVVKIPDGTSWDVAASLGIAALTPYHALKEARLKESETLIVFGASGNTGMFATQFGNLIGAKVIAVSSREWIKDFGADFVVSRENSVEQIKKITKGKLGDVVLNSVGKQVWQESIDSLGLNGRLMTFGGWINFGGDTGFDVNLDVQSVYGKHAKIIGTTGGRLDEFRELTKISDKLKVKVWKKFKLEEGREALELLYSKERDGRIIIEC